MIYDCTDKKLISGSVEFFAANLAIKELFVSEDGQYFHSVSRSNYHCKTNGLKVFRIKREQLPTEKKPAAEKQPEKQPEKTAEKEPEKAKEPEPKKAGRPAGSKSNATNKNSK